MWGMLLATVSILIFPNFIHSKPIVPCYFIFGDSLSDAGNNNILATGSKSNYVPYGIDFYGGSTGRFTNGRTYVDIIGELLGFQGYIAPYNDVAGPLVFKGVNYASGAAGIRPESGSHMGDRISMDGQLKNHIDITTNKLQFFVKRSSVSEYLSKCLYTVDIGSNDYNNNYFMPMYYPTQRMFTIQQYAAQLVDQYSHQLQELYKSGARKVVVFGLGRLGCIPQQMLTHNGTQCVDKVNQAVQLFNHKLILVIHRLNSQFPKAKYTFIDTYAMQLNSPPQGLILERPCCRLRLDFHCKTYLKPCPDRNKYSFMDGFHPTEVVNIQRARLSFNSTNPKFFHPMNISRLLSL